MHMREKLPCQSKSQNFVTGLTLSSTSLDQDNISVFYDVVLALGHDLTSCLDGSFVSIFPEGGIVEDDALNESLLEICNDEC